MKKDQVVIIQVTLTLSSLSNPQTLTIVTLYKQRKKIIHQEEMKGKTPEQNMQTRKFIGMKEIDLLKEDRLFQGTKISSMVIVFSALILVTKL